MTKFRLIADEDQAISHKFDSKQEALANVNDFLNYNGLDLDETTVELVEVHGEVMQCEYTLKEVK